MRHGPKAYTLGACASASKCTSLAKQEQSRAFSSDTSNEFGVLILTAHPPFERILI